MNKHDIWRTRLDPRDPDYLGPDDDEEATEGDDFAEPDDDQPEHDGPEDYEGTARYHY